MLSNLNVVETCRSGLMFDVQRAIDPSTNKDFAVKILRRSSLNNKKHVEMLKNEWNAVKKLEHPNILEYYEYGKKDGLPFIVMEWMEAVNLKSFIERNFPSGLVKIDRKSMFDIRGRFEAIITGAIETIRYIHDRNIIHLDIKPENFLVTEQGKIKLIDFSNARAGFWQKRKKVTSIDGTPSFISPEQIKRERPSELTDIYSLAATIYYLMTGNPPFTGSNMNEILKKHLSAKHTPLFGLVPGLRKEFSNIIDNMLTKNMNDRLANLSTVLGKIKKEGMFPKLAT